MNNFKDLIASIVQNNREPDWLKDIRFKALEQLEKTIEPVIKNDELRKWDLNLTDDLNFSTVSSQYQKEEKVWVPGSEIKLNPVLLSGKITDGVICSSLSEACRHSSGTARFYFEKIAAETCGKSALLNLTFWIDGIFLYVPENVSVDLPVSLLLNFAGLKQKQSCFSDLLIIVDKNSSLNLFADHGDQLEFQNSFYEMMNIVLKENSRCSFLNLDRRNDRAAAFSDCHVCIEKNASLKVLDVNVGASFFKSDWKIDLVGEGASLNFFGIVKGDAKQRFYKNLFADHGSSSTQSNVLCKTVLSGESKSVFSGLIRIGQKTKKCNAYQKNQNLLLSKNARADTIPKLEIETDDVQCGHGATVSSIDPEQLFYLLSRGVNEKEARELIVEGFCEDVLKRWMNESGLKTEFEDEVLSSVKTVLLKKSSVIPVHV